MRTTSTGACAPLLAVSCLALATAIGALASPAFAQQAAEEAESSDAIEDLVVTAQRRDENLQDVPLSVTAFTANDALERGILGTGDLPAATPGLVMTPTLGIPQIYIRGVGTQNTSAGDEPSNAVYVDGVYMPDMPSGLFSLNNIERIEVLKGPQGTLFGRNATGGLIQVITRDPSFTPGADLTLGYASYDTVTSTFYGTTPLSERVAVDLALSYSNQGEGWGTNIATGGDIYEERNFSARSKLLWDIDAQTSLRLAIDYSNAYGDTIMGRQPIEGTSGYAQTPYTGDFYDVNMNLPPYSATEGSGASVNFQRDLGWANFTSITAYRMMTFEFLADQDSSPIDQNNAIPVQDTRMFTQEFQLSSPQSSDIAWIGGLFFYNHDLSLLLTRYGNALTAAGGFAETHSDQQTMSYAAYAQATFPVTENLNATLGARYTLDEREFQSFGYTPVAGVTNVIDTSEDWSQVTWRSAVDYSFNDDVMVYASYSRGFKSGIYPSYSPRVDPIDPEVLDAIEVGFRSDLFDGRLRINGSLFHYDYQDIQLVVTRAGSSILLNAEGAEIQGFDGELLFRPTRGLELRANVNVTDGEYTDFPAAPATLPNPVVVVPPGYTCPAVRPVIPGGTLGCSAPATGNTTIRTPELTYTLGANYQWDTSFGAFTADLNLYHNSGYFFEVDNRVESPSYNTVNAQLHYQTPEGRYGLRLWARNLTDEEYFAVVSTSLADTFTPAPPRTIGVTFEAHF